MRTCAELRVTYPIRHFNMSYLNPIWLLSQLLEKTGIAVVQINKVEFAAHLFAGTTFALAGVLWGWWLPAVWAVLSLLVEFVFDGWKGRDTIVDLCSRLAGSVAYGVWLLVR